MLDYPFEVLANLKLWISFLTPIKVSQVLKLECAAPDQCKLGAIFFVATRHSAHTSPLNPTAGSIPLLCACKLDIEQTSHKINLELLVCIDSCVLSTPLDTSFFETLFFMTCLLPTQQLPDAERDFFEQES